MLAINIPADGLFLTIQKKACGDYSKINCERIINEFIGRFLEAQPDLILLNVCYRRALTPSKVFDSYLYDVVTDEQGFAARDSFGRSVKVYSPVTQIESKYFMSFVECARELLKNGIDIYRIAIDRIRQADSRVLLSVRMNDAHYTDDPAINASFAMKNGGQHTIGQNGKYLDFSQEAVRNHYYAYVEELLENYSVDGIEIDWLRYPTVLPALHRDDYHILNAYMRKMRQLLDRYSKSACLAVRMLSTEEENLEKGFDVCQWIADGCVDILTIENFYIPTNYELPVSQWKEHIRKRNTDQKDVHLLCGSDWGVSCVALYNIAMTPALVRGFVSSCLDAGADGVYLFNYFEENDDSSFELVEDENGQPQLENCFLERIKAANHPDSLPKRHVHIGNSNSRYPIPLAQKGCYKFEKAIKGSFDKCRIVIGCDRDVPLEVAVNGFAVAANENDPVFPGFEYIPEGNIGKKSHFIYAVTQAAPFVRTVCLPGGIFDNEILKVEIRNASSQAVHLLWIEVIWE